MIKLLAFATLLNLIAPFQKGPASGKLFAREKSGIDFNFTYIRENRGSFTYPETDITQKDRDYERRLLKKLEVADHLGAIKYDIINGDFEQAELRMLQTRFEESFSAPIQMRYRAMLNFAKGDYKKSLKILEHPEFSKFKHQDNICLLKTLNQVILDQSQEAKETWQYCQKFIASNSGNSNIWMNALINLKIQQEKSIAAKALKDLAIEYEKDDRLRLFLKLALYLNKQDVILPRIPYLAANAFENPKTRELLGLLYYRDYDFVNAYNLIEDLSTPNALNIKGNILLAQKKLELAYAQFKQALIKKNDSQNSLERITPAAWSLNQWEEGAQFASQLETTERTKDSGLALEAAFLTKSEKPNLALKKLNEIINKNVHSGSLEVNQLYGYNSFAIGNNRDLFHFSNAACEQKDAFSCWIKSQLLIWEDLPALAKRKGGLHDESTSIIESLQSSFSADPIKEKIYIQQKEIEELEDREMMIINSSAPK